MIWLNIWLVIAALLTFAGTLTGGVYGFFAGIGCSLILLPFVFAGTMMWQAWA